MIRNETVRGRSRKLACNTEEADNAWDMRRPSGLSETLRFEFGTAESRDNMKQVICSRRFGKQVSAWGKIKWA